MLLSVLAASLVSCSKSSVKDNEDYSPFDFALKYTSVAEDGNTKQSVSNPFYEVYWDASDAVAVYNATKSELSRYVVKSGAGTKIAVFTPDNVVPSYDASDELYIIYPYDAASLEGSTLYLSIYRDAIEDSYSSSKGANKVFSRNDLLMSERFTPASISGGDIDITKGISLHRLVALLQLTTAVSDAALTNEEVQRVRLKCKGVAGRSAVVFSDGVPSLSYNGGSKDECVFLTSDGPKMASKDYLGRFIPIFPVNMNQDPNNGFSFILESDEYEVGFHRALDYNIKSNANVNFFLSNGLFGLTPVEGELAATTEFSWWWGYKTANANAGSFVSVPEMVVGGNYAGSFVNGN